MILALRFIGWGAFLAGMVLFIWAGGFSSVQDVSPLKRTLAWVGILTALGGMLSTSTSRLLTHFQQQRRFREKIRERTAAQWGALKPVEKRPPAEPPAE